MSDCDKIEASCTIPQSRKRKVQQENGKWTESKTTLLIYLLAQNECFYLRICKERYKGELLSVRSVSDIRVKACLYAILL